MTGAAFLRRSVPAALSVLALIGAIWIWADRIDLEVVSSKLRAIDPLYAALAALSMFLFAPVNAYRLKRISLWIADARLRYLAVFRLTCIGQFVAATAPLGFLGDIAKVALIKPAGALSWRQSLQCILCDRATGAIFLAFLGMLSVFARALSSAISSTFYMDFILYILVLGSSAALIKGNRLVTRWNWRFWDIPGSILSAMARLFHGIRRVGAQLGFALANVALTVCAIMLLAVGMELPLDMLQVTFYTPAIMIVSSLPFLYLGWGGREIIVVSTIGSLPGVSANEVLSLSIALGTLTTLVSLPFGLFLLVGWRRRGQNLPEGS